MRKTGAIRSRKVYIQRIKKSIIVYYVLDFVTEHKCIAYTQSTYIYEKRSRKHSNVYANFLFYNEKVNRLSNPKTTTTLTLC